MRRLFVLFRAVFIVALTLVLPLVSAMAQDVTWQTIRVQGEGKSAMCSQNTVHTSFAGSTAAFVFSNFGINLPAGSQHQSGSEFGGCRIVTRMTIPQGYYLAGLSQTTIAGVVKSVGAKGEIRSRLDVKSMGSESIENRVEFAPKDEINEPMLLLIGSFNTSSSSIAHTCKFSARSPVTMDLEFRASIKGQRKTGASSVLVYIDSSDVQLNLGARLARCP